MTSINLEKTLKYLKIRESLRSGNFVEYYLCMQKYFGMFFSTPKYILQAANETNH